MLIAKSCFFHGGLSIWTHKHIFCAYLLTDLPIYSHTPLTQAMPRQLNCAHIVHRQRRRTSYNKKCLGCWSAMSLRSRRAHGQPRLCSFERKMVHTGSVWTTDDSMLSRSKTHILFLGSMTLSIGCLEHKCSARLI